MFSEAVDSLWRNTVTSPYGPFYQWSIYFSGQQNVTQASHSSLPYYAAEIPTLNVHLVESMLAWLFIVLTFVAVILAITSKYHWACGFSAHKTWAILDFAYWPHSWECLLCAHTPACMKSPETELPPMPLLRFKFQKLGNRSKLTDMLHPYTEVCHFE